MVLEIFLILIFTGIFCLLIYKVPFFRMEQLSPATLSSIFLLKVVFAVFFGVLHYTYYGMVDTFVYFHDGNTIFSTLANNPLHYLRLTFGINSVAVPGDLEPVIGKMGFWGDTGSYFVVRFHALIRLVSFGFYNVHAVFMAFLSFIGLVALYKTFLQYYPKRYLWLAIAIFLIPSVLFYGSGLHKEGLLIFGLGLVLYHFHKGIKLGFVWWRIAAVVLAFMLVFFIKEFFVAALFPCLIGYLWVEKRPQRAWLKFSAVVVIFWLVMINLDLVLPTFDIIGLMAEKQSEFMQLSGNSDIAIPELQPYMSTVIGNIPEALVNTTMRPFPTEIFTIYQFFYFVEIFIIILMTVLAIVFFKRKLLRHAPLVYLSFYFSITTFIIIGLIVPNLGAISRYKTPALMFFICFLIFITDWKKVRQFAKAPLQLYNW